MPGLERRWRVPADLPAFSGHFPGRPVVPGVVLLDRVLQMVEADADRCGLAWQIGQVKFLLPCGPGDELCFELREGVRGGFVFSVLRDGQEVATGAIAPCPA